jgi:hypothetical protein
MDHVDVLDVTTGIWSTDDPLDYGRSQHTSTLVGDRLYVIGGLDAGGE